MFKFLRKYNKLLLAIFGVLLMITFLIPQAIENFSRQSGANRAAVATVGAGEKVTGNQWNIVQREVQFMQRLGIGVPGMGSVQQMKPEHWYLLVREAEAAGLVGTGGSIDLSSEMLVQLAMAGGERDQSFIRNLMAKMDGVQQMLALYQSGGMYSDRRLKHAAERMLAQVTAQLVVIESDQANDIEPTEEEIAAQFAKYADVFPNTGDEPFGYKLPDRVKLEWLHIPADSVREVVRQSDAFNSIAQRMHWRRFASDPTKGFPPLPENNTGEDVPEVVSNDLLAQLTQETLDEVAKFATDQLRLNRRGIPERDGYVMLPTDWDERKLAFSQIAADIQSTFGIELPAYESTGDRWTPISELSQLDGISIATTDRFGSNRVGLTQLVSAAKEFSTGTTSTIFIQKDVAGPPLKTSDGSVYLFRIVDADPAHTPKSVDEVRETVVADLKRVADYKQLVDSAAAIEVQAETQGVLSVAMAHNAQVQPASSVSMANRFLLMQQAQSRQPVTATPSFLPIIGQHRPTVEAIIDYALTIPHNTAIDSLPEEQRVIVVPVPDRLALVVARLMRKQPISQEDYANLVQLGAIQQLLAAEDAKDSQMLEGAYSLEALAKRNQFAFTRTLNEDGSTSEQQPPADSSANAG